MTRRHRFVDDLELVREEPFEPTIGTALGLIETIAQTPDLEKSAADAIDELPTMTDVQMCALLSFCTHLSRVAYVVKHAAEKALAEELGEGGGIRWGDTFIKYSRGRAFKVTDGPALTAWLGEDLLEVINFERAVQVSRLAALAKARAQADSPVLLNEAELENAAKAITDTFGEYEWSPAKVKQMPVGGKYTPKYAARMGEGDRLFPKVIPIEELAERSSGE